MKRILIFTFWTLCIAAPALSAPVLLVEFTHNVETAELGNPLPAKLLFDFDVFERGQSPYLSWPNEFGPSDVGKIFTAPTDLVNGAHIAIRSPTARYFFETGPANFSSELELSPAVCQTNECVKHFVACAADAQCDNRRADYRPN